MPHTKSALKRLRQAEKRRLRNKAWRTRVKNAVREAREAILAGEKEKAEQLIREAVRVIDKAVSKGVLHKNEGARRKSRLMALYNKAFLQKEAA
ncbi:MAG TPA: 30S ribosomal protein S20 [Armatimonadetes bacterium]|nr:30S ribosomal protein S20 [Armatimonadota bacterium]